MTRVFAALFLSLMLVSSTDLTAQGNASDTSFRSAATALARQFYFQSIKAQSNLYIGSDYVEYNQRQDEHPFFLTDDWAMGSITYDGDEYEEVPLMYDISQQKVVAEHLSTASKIALVSQRVHRFKIYDHTFIWLEREDGMHPSITTGFYDVLYDGKIKVMARRQKQIQERAVSAQLMVEFDEINRYFIFRNNNFFPVKSKASVMSVLGDQRNRVKQFIHKNKIRFRANREKALAQTAEFYDSITE